jgi:hypothetical protein
MARVTGGMKATAKAAPVKLAGLGQARPLLAYGVPAAAGLAVGGALAAQGEDPGSAALGGIAGALGARGALGASRLAGKYAAGIGLPRALQDRAMSTGVGIADYIQGASPGGVRQKVGTQAINQILEFGAALDKPNYGLNTAAAAVGVPAGAALAGLGGVAAGSVPGALGIPGFTQQQAMQMQENVVDPEEYGSSNSAGARYKAPTLQYL